MVHGAELSGKLANIVLFVGSCALVGVIGKQTNLESGGKSGVAYLARSPNQLCVAICMQPSPLALCVLLRWSWAHEFHVGDGRPG